jgi:tetraacyldisaccharide 4'-kinase
VGVRLSGDEAQEHAQASRAQVWVDPDRIRAARAALSAGAGALVLDDGFQRRHQLARSLDLLLADFDDLAMGEHLLPAGPWREPWSQAAEADALLLGSAPAGMRPAQLRDALPPAFRGLPLFTLKRQPAGLRAWPDGGRVPLKQLKKLQVLALSGLGRPQSFEAGLEALGARVTPWRFRDHHRFTHRQLNHPPEDAEAIVTTAKDAVRLPPGWRPQRPLWVLELRAQVSPVAAFNKLVDDALLGRRTR